jgi:hypothetical protein
MVLIGCVLALIWRVMVHGKPVLKYSDPPAAFFCLWLY